MINIQMFVLKKKETNKKPSSIATKVMLSSMYLFFFHMQCKSRWLCRTKSNQSLVTKMTLHPGWFPQGQKDVHDVHLGLSAVFWFTAQ